MGSIAQKPKDTLGYALPTEWYLAYKENKSVSSIKNKEILNGCNQLNREAEYHVVTCKEWKEIKKKYEYDVEVPVGMVNVHIKLKEKQKIEKEFPVDGTQIIFEVFQVVLFSKKMTEETFTDLYNWKINGDVTLKDALIKCEAENVYIEIERKIIEEEEAVEMKPSGFRNIGLSCYMNTALQVLLGVPELSQRILEIDRKVVKEIAQKRSHRKGYNREKGCSLFLAYKGLLESIKKEQDCWESLREIKRVLGSIDSRYGRCSEEDAAEVFSLILTNFDYLFEKTKYSGMVSELFKYSANQVQTFLDANRNEIITEKKHLYNSFVLNGTFGSEQGPHAHVLVIHANQLICTSLCIHIKNNTRLIVGEVKKIISENLEISRDSVVSVEISSEGQVFKRSDEHSFISRKYLYEQPIFYIIEEAQDNIEFVFLNYQSQREGAAFFISLFGGDEATKNLPFVIKKQANITDFLKDSLRISRSPEDSKTLLDIQNGFAESKELFGSMSIVISHKHWNASEYLHAIKERKNKLKECTHIQCVITNWENRSTRKPKKEEKSGCKQRVDNIIEYTQFCKFSEYFCVQLPLGLGSSYKGEKMYEKEKFHVEREGLILNGSVYSLSGVFVHHNFGSGGHYVAFTKREDVWYHCNDGTINIASGKEAVSTGYPYGLLYRRNKTKNK
ncbi:hypothetical protein NEFER03_1828 [Nematocida sp. LUAm3]|nr:hypothetical protein NEFER03_1828 [Nematocida sp. LUAm3]KAI5173865.1 hypothetical protein NEFER02_0332 [Nematocida sp. LUAm2]KAI5177390.1 hypothetical protein NEFER01_0665 [Nematocida sp. LUAm1]